MKPSWDDAPEVARYLAQDRDGTWWWFENEPYLNHDGTDWLSSGEIFYAEPQELKKAGPMEPRP